MTGIVDQAVKRQLERGRIHEKGGDLQELSPVSRRVGPDALERHFASLDEQGVQILTYRQTKLTSWKVMVELMRDPTCHARVQQGDKYVPYYASSHHEGRAKHLAAKYGIMPLFNFSADESPTGKQFIWGLRPEQRVAGLIRTEDGLKAAPNDYADLRNIDLLSNEFAVPISEEIAAFYGVSGRIDLSDFSFIAMPNGEFAKADILLRSEDARRSELHIVDVSWDARTVFREILIRATAGGRKVSDICFEPLGDVGRGGTPLYRIRFGTNKKYEDVDLSLDEPAYDKLVTLLDTWGKEVNSRDRVSPADTADAAIRLRHESLGLSFVEDTSNMAMGQVYAKGDSIPFPAYTRSLSFRLNRLPVINGQSMTLRIQYPSRFASVQSIGFTPLQTEALCRLVEEPEGLLVMTGPTGEGKTTTLYAFLAHLNDPSRRLITVEEPVEMELPGVVQVKLGKELGFAKGLRAILRSAPNVVLVGEVRDLETADAVVQAGMTGHFVLSTLHTHNAIGVVSRMDGIGVAPHEVAQVLRVASSQRLLPTINQDLAVDDGNGGVTFPQELFEFEDILPDLNKLFGTSFEGELVTLKPRSPEEVGDPNFQGSRGSAAVIEILKVNDRIRNLIIKRAGDEEITRSAMLQEGLRYVPMQFHGLALVLDGKVAFADWQKKFGTGWVEDNQLNRAFGQAFLKYALEHPEATYDDLLYRTPFDPDQPVEQQLSLVANA